MDVDGNSNPDAKSGNATESDDSFEGDETPEDDASTDEDLPDVSTVGTASHQTRSGDGDDDGGHEAEVGPSNARVVGTQPGETPLVMLIIAR